MSAAFLADYFRRDQSDGITAPDLSKLCTLAEHIVRARGKRTKYTSVSLELNKIDDFGPSLYRALRDVLAEEQHPIIEHAALMTKLREMAQTGEKADRIRALQAQRYAKRRSEGLIDWQFDITRVPRKDVITWAFCQVQRFFQEV
jgi:hypothetical protein